MRTLSSRTIAFLLISWWCCLSTALHAQDDFLSDEDFFEEDLGSAIHVSDPLEVINRYTFAFNDWVYMKLLKPLVNVYQDITPDPVEKAAINFFVNLKYPIRLAGNLLQGRWEGAWVETGRFAINSTVGIFGLFTPADKVDGFAPIPKEDIGQALGSWGIGEGPYLVLPLLGPSNLRDLGGMVGDRSVNPLDEPFSLIDDWNWEWRSAAISGTDFTANSPGILELYLRMKGSAIDPYSSMKQGYTQFRRAAVKQ